MGSVASAFVRGVTVLNRIAEAIDGSPSMPAPLAVFVLEIQANLDVDVFTAVLEFIRISVAAGVIGLAASLWFYRRSRGRGQPSVAAPRSLRDANDALDEIARFERV
jgi:hypothetical protein